MAVLTVQPASFPEPAPPTASPRPPGGGEPAARRLRPGRYLPFLTVAAATVAGVHYYGVGWRVLAAFLAYVALCLALPGVLVWRAARRRAASLAEDLAPGLALGYAMEVPAYLVARAVGLPLAVLAVPAVTVLLFLAVRPLRRWWRTDRDLTGPPLAWLWGMAAIVAVMMTLTCLAYLRTHAPAFGFDDGDLAYHLALIGEARHHVPPQVPWVAGEPLQYHWFGYLHVASSSWITGIEPETLLLRLYHLPLVAGLPLALGAAARRLTGRWWPGLVAPGIALFGLAPNPFSFPMPPSYVFHGFGPLDDGNLLRQGVWISVTQTFAAFVCIPLVIVLVDLVRGRDGRRRTWVLLAGLVAVMTGAKATYLPILLGGLALVVVVTWIAHRRLHRVAVAGGAVVALGVVFAQVVLLGGAAHGMLFDPLGSVRLSGLSMATGLYREPLSAAVTAELSLLTVAAWIMIWCGAAGLLVGRRWADPAHALLIGAGLAGMGGVLAFSHYGHGQTWFLVAARPYLALAAAAGMAALLPVGRAAGGRGLALAGAAGAAGAFAWFVREAGPAAVPSRQAEPDLLRAFAWPYAVLAGAVVLAVLGLWPVARRSWRVRLLLPALIVVVVTAYSVQPAVDVVTRAITVAAADGLRTAAPPTPMPAGARGAGRWLRNHSAPDDLVATNAHCRRPRPCDNLHFWFAAFAERRFLVEGWGFTSKANEMPGVDGRPPTYAPFWDPSLLAENDAAFLAPSPATIGRLRQRGVRWLIVDEKLPVSAALGRHAELRARYGQCAVYEI